MPKDLPRFFVIRIRKRQFYSLIGFRCEISLTRRLLKTKKSLQYAEDFTHVPSLRSGFSTFWCVTFQSSGMLIADPTGWYPFECQSVLAAVGLITSIGAHFFFSVQDLTLTTSCILIAMTVIVYILAFHCVFTCLTHLSTRRFSNPAWVAFETKMMQVGLWRSILSYSIDHYVKALLIANIVVVTVLDVFITIILCIILHRQRGDINRWVVCHVLN